MEAFFEEDELTPEDLAFLEQWESAGKDSDKHEQNILSEVETEGHTEVEAAAEDPHATEGIGDETDEYSDQGGGESTEGDEIDESKMDISHMEGDEPNEEELGDYSDADDESDTELSDEAEDRDQLKNGETDSDIPEAEDELEYDGLDNTDSDSSDSDNDNDGDDLESDFDSENAESEEDGDTEQVETEFGDGERANTDEEIEDLDEYQQEREEHEQELNAEGEENFEGDAQAELEDHLRNNQEDGEPESDESDNDEEDSEADLSGASEPEPDNSDDDDSDEDADDGHESEDSAENSEREPLTEEPDENQEGDDEQHSGMFDHLPESGDRCTNHCEDNAPEDSLEETCPHCTERIRKERELHGAIATDMHGNDVLPGDKLHIKVPIAMIAKDAIVTVNVPNTEIDPIRLAENTKGQTDIERCWLSGKGVSKFTSWHMTGAKGQSIWTFKKGTEITFAEKIAQPLFDSDDPDDIMEKFQEELEKLPESEGSNGEQETEAEEAEPQEDAPEDELETPGDEPDDEDSGRGSDDNGDESGESDDSSGEPESEIEVEQPDYSTLIEQLGKLEMMAELFDMNDAAEYLKGAIQGLHS